jgi:hypothetical protein
MFLNVSRQGARRAVAEGEPSLQRRGGSPNHVLRQVRLSNLETELQQFAVDTWSAPQRIVDPVGRKNMVRRLWRCQVAGEALLLRWMLGGGLECYVPRLSVHDGASGAVWAASGRAARNASKSWHQFLRSKT